jgi:hypothetical protein
MSSTWRNVVFDATFGYLGKHLIGQHLEQLGWIDAEAVLLPPQPGVYSFELADLARPGPVAGYRLARLPIPATNLSWTLEARAPTGTYDAALPGAGVLVHERSPDRFEPMWAFDAAVPPGNYSDGPGVLWTVGETFEDAAHAISMTVDRATPDGFAVTVRYLTTAELFRDGFESGGWSAWSDAAP